MSTDVREKREHEKTCKLVTYGTICDCRENTIHQLEQKNGRLRDALTTLVSIKRAMGFGGSAWDKAEEVLKESPNA